MKCQLCDAEASYHYTEIKDDKIVEIHLCHACAKEKGLETEGESSLFLADMLSGLAGMDEFVGDQKKPKPQTEPVCMQCGLKFSQFKKTGKFGCGACYAEFSREVTPLLKRIHGSLHHTGKKPRRMGEGLLHYEKIKELKDELQKAIVNEEYETAARLRDQIRQLSEAGRSGEGGAEEHA